MAAVLKVSEAGARYLDAPQPAVVRQFDFLATAPDGVARMRELILTLAVRGKLFPPKDWEGSASNDADDLPCELPKGWKWVRLSDLGEFRGGKTPSTQRSDYWGGATPWITPKDMKQLRLSDSQDRVTSKAVADGLALIPPRSLLIVVRSGILRRTVPTAINQVETTINQDLKALVFTRPELGPYIQLLVRGFERYILENLTKVGTTVESIRFDDFASQLFPLPPLAEQGRIVAHVDELMRLCDALETKSRLEAEQHARLLTTLLGTLTDSRSPDELAVNWKRIAAHFDLLLDRPEAVDGLEQTILDLAVRGLLLRQWSADKSLANEVQLGLPRSWQTVRLTDVCTLITDGEHATPERTVDSNAVPLVTAKNVRSEVMDYTQTDFVSKVVAERCWKRCKPADRDILMVSVGATLGRLCIVWQAIEMVLVRSVTLIRPDEGLVDVAYLALHLMAPRTQTEIWGSVKQSAQPCLYLGKSAALAIALPPLDEQRRIVARVNQLRALCADLRQRLATQQTTQNRLAEALVESATAA